MKYSLAVLFLATGLSLRAQYYYDDILSNQELAKTRQTLVSNRVRSITSTGFDRNGTRATDFSEYQELKEEGRLWTTTTVRSLERSVTLTRFNAAGQVSSITDSGALFVNTTRFTYDNAGKLTLVENGSDDTSRSFTQTEYHYWSYGANGKPEKMWRVVKHEAGMEGLDSMELRFVYDENGRLSEEHAYKKGKETGFLYYYYDEAGNLTDIVRYNTRANRLLPDLMFEYDEQGRILQKITTTSSMDLGYLIWRYIYNEKGLKTKEALFDGKKELTGKIEYSYSFY